jgi:RNA polymerase sigma-70 factor (ECF subfamily)
LLVQGQKKLKENAAYFPELGIFRSRNEIKKCLIKEEQDIDSIISGCKKDNRKSQELLYRSYYRVMMNLCLRYTKNESDAMEVLNTGFYKVFKNIGRYDASQASLYTWIRTIIVNSCLDFIKAGQKRMTTEEVEKAGEVHIPAEIISRMKTADLLALVRTLPAATQAVFNLYAMEGYKHSEIATLLQISEGTSKWHLSEARKKLQQIINEQATNS